MPCRLQKSFEWGIRIAHEAKLNGCNNMFVTRTYDNDYLPENRSLSVQVNQKYIARFRDAIQPQRFRFYTGAEYSPLNLENYLKRQGEYGSRPHYHDCILGYRFPDLKKLKEAPGGGTYYTSEFASKLWPYGYVLIGELSVESAAYTARYCTKKYYGEPRAYDWVDPADGILHERVPEFALMSRMPGIGMPWLEKYAQQTLKTDYVIVKGRKVSMPKAYERWFLGGMDGMDGDIMREVKEKRLDQAMMHPEWVWNNSPDRLMVQEEVLRAKLRRVDKDR